MLRVLFVILAVVTALLAAVLKMAWLYALAAVMLVIAVVTVVVYLRKRHEKEAEPFKKASSREDELKSLGIMEIRPRDKSATPERPARKPVRPPAAVEPEEAPAKAVDTPNEPEEEEGEPRRASRIYAEAPTSATPEAIHANGETMEMLDKQVLVPYLQSLRAALGATTVCLLRRDEHPARYHIEAIVSENAYARTKGHFTADAPLLDEEAPRQPVSVQRVGELGTAPRSLGYYREPISIRQIALAPVPHTTDLGRLLLLADTMEHGGLSSKQQRGVMGQFAALLATVVNARAAQEADVVRPRREIIAEEMERARAEGLPLALALVYPNRAEAISDEGDAYVSAAEETLEVHLRNAVAGRVEHFGELTYGVFYYGSADEIEVWGMGLHDELAGAGEPLTGGASIGIAVLQDRHQTADAFREDAYQALSAAYESGTCTILE